MTDTALATIERRHDLDALRAIAMLSGIVLHAALSFSLIPWIVQDNQQHDAFSLIFSSLHGFRIHLFFLISGFFTAMLWRKRGLKSLLWHRFRHIFLPLLLGLITIIPVNIWIVLKAMESGAGQVSQSAPSGELAADIWAATRLGDLNAINLHIEKGADINGKDPVLGQTPLALAAIRDHPEAVDLLLEKGADVNAVTIDGSTALHSAAFLGRVKIAEILLQNGADPTVRNRHGATPLQSLDADKGITQFIASLLKIELDWETVQTRRLAVADILKESSSLSADNQQGSAAMLWYTLFQTPIFQHLWFLWFLCWFVAAFAVYAVIADWLKLKIPSGLILSPVRYLWLIPLTLIPQVYMFMPIFGPDTSDGLLPMPHVLLFYAIFFGFGALYYDVGDKTGRVGRWYWLSLPVALFVVFPLALVFMYSGSTINEWIDPSMQQPVANVLQVLYAWLMTFGCMGLFRQLLSRDSKTLRYLSDSSYWLYIAHLPLVIWAQAIVRDWPLPAWIKFSIICIGVSGFLLLTYQWLVRYTPLGTLLNGKRKRPVSDAEM